MNQNYIIKIAESKEEIKQYFDLRQEVFVDEQKIFEETDQDQHDEQSILIIAKEKDSGLVVGTVRCYPIADRVWIGGRLTVRKNYRGKQLGVQLVRETVKIMIERGCRDFSAYIQIQNVGFFEGLGWTKIGEAVIFHGVYHEKMTIDLNKFKEKYMD